MRLKIIQVNIYQGKYIDKLIDFLRAEYPDVITLQEVSSGLINLCDDKSNLFEILKRRLEYQGIFFPTSRISDKPDTFIGNAVLTRHLITNGSYYPLKSHSSMPFSVFNDPAMFESLPRGIVEASVEFSGRSIDVLSCHGAWSIRPVDTKEKVRQAKLIANHIKSLKNPFIMGSDLNMTLGSRVVNIVSDVSKNWIIGCKIKRTTHPVVHKTVGTFPDGLVVDYLFSSNDFKLKSLEAPEVLVSDHLPLVAELELKD